MLKLDPRIRLGLERMERALALLGSPETAFASVIVAGTNGKGSVAASVESIARAAGYKTGLFTSPHLIDENERVRIAGRAVSAAEWRGALRRVIGVIRRGRVSLTEFEVHTAAAFLIFAARAVDLAVVEVGLGGRLDATNALPIPEAAAITSIGFDHTQFLGGTLPKILDEKMGVIRPGAPLVTALPPALVKRCRARCRREAVPARFFGGDFSATPGAVDWRRRRQFFDYQSPRASFRRLETPLLGKHQIANGALSVALCQELRARGWDIREPHLRRGLKSVSWPARFQILPPKRGFGRPAIVDGAHNPAAIETYMKTYAASPWGGRRATIIFGCLEDKDAAGMIRRLAPVARRVFTVDLPTPRGASALDLAALWRRTTPAEACATAREALDRARGDSSPLLIAGSLYLAGGILKEWRRL